ncbi:MAG TPA: S41 family peptidase [Terriglobales bacterium]|jgi:C-terminal processing protease CtpA/Prc
MKRVLGTLLLIAALCSAVPLPAQDHSNPPSVSQQSAKFLPPAVDYGWQDQMIGDRCYITRVHSRTDAKSKGLKPGQQIITIDGYVPTRENFRKIEEVYRALRPQTKMDLLIQNPNGVRHSLVVKSKIHKPFVAVYGLHELHGRLDNFVSASEYEEEQTPPYEEQNRARFVDRGRALTILKLADLNFDNKWMDLFKKHVRKRDALILDLRGVSGGTEDEIANLLGGMFDKQIRIGDGVKGTVTGPTMTRSKEPPFTGSLIVLVDSNSTGGAELFARIIQREKRGVVIGDRTSGTAMSYFVDFEPRYTFSTPAPGMAADGRANLKDSGVVPDQIMLPSPDDLAKGRDPILAYAIEKLGVKTTPEKAGKMFSYKGPDSY